MMDARTFATGALGIVLLTYGVEGQGVAQYRNFRAGIQCCRPSPT